jgi:hypothetical protein
MTTRGVEWSYCRRLWKIFKGEQLGCQDSDCQDPALSWNHSLEYSSSVCLCASRQAERTNTLMYFAFFFVVHHGDHSEPLHFRLCIYYPDLTYMSCKLPPTCTPNNVSRMEIVFCNEDKIPPFFAARGTIFVEL